MENKKWEYKENFHAIGMTGDYDGHYELTNGNISLCTNDDPEDITETENTLQRVAKALNESGCKFYCNTTTEHKLHIENMELRYKTDELHETKQQADNLRSAYDELGRNTQRMADALEEIKEVHKKYHDLNGDNPAANHLMNIANEGLTGWQQLKDGGKEVVRPEHNVSIGEHITYCHDCGFPVDECNCILTNPTK